MLPIIKTEINGRIVLNTLFEIDPSPSGLLIINGGNASRDNGLMVQNTAGLGALTLQKGTLVVDTFNNGTTDRNSFT
ncbi:MAG: hypothetical protein H2069_08585 [Legionella sp.]|nr:hypothetical protein [Legionella sp.]